MHIVGQRKTCRISYAVSSKSSDSSKISLEYVSNVIQRLQSRQTRNSTTLNYLGIWRHLNKFIINLDYREHLSWEERTALFEAHLIEGGVQSSTLKSYFSAIKYILKLDSYHWDEDKAVLSSLVKSCKLENDRVRIRLPIQRGLLEMLLFELERVYSDQPYLESMFKAMFCLAYYGMLRVGELTASQHTLKACNVHLSNKNKIMLVLYTAKTHGLESGPQKIKITVGSSSSKLHFCPIRVVTHYMNIRGSYLDTKEEFFVYSERSPIQPQQLRNTLRSTLNKLNLNGDLYDVHSFRGGQTADLAKLGYSIDQIKWEDGNPMQCTNTLSTRKKHGILTIMCNKSQEVINKSMRYTQN